MSGKSDLFTDFAIFLRKKIPIKKKVVIRRVVMHHLDGSTSLSDRGLITVVINKDLEITGQVDTLIHEWGHVLEYDKCGIHGVIWGKGYSQAYEAWEEFAANRK